jgi:hypothetical protein
MITLITDNDTYKIYGVEKWSTEPKVKTTQGPYQHTLNAWQVLAAVYMYNSGKNELRFEEPIIPQDSEIMKQFIRGLFLRF